ncbi:hypothetical protein [Halobacterium salinarum]|uniref:hypothetical protein n=1 Tax=Halobacterium salinarum TaxID=2242 RepID=UPI0025560CD5|nr:hypothetical protein [Halobacterium salinarum]MDL0127087.1 hypothetical protein [Halobacterium salinarum]
MNAGDLLAWAIENRELAITLLTVLTGTGGTVRHYQRTGRLPLSTLPWRGLRRLFYRARKHFFTVRRPKQPSFTPVDPIDAVRDRLGRESYQPGWPLSYHYYGEDLNARRYVFDPDAEHPHRQLHIRGFELDNGSVELIAHEEPDPIMHPRAHLAEQDMHDATPWLKDAWTASAGLDPRTFDRQQTDG